jgi:hypothetical protein
MAGRSSNFISEHIEKIALVLAGILCLYLLFTGVIMTPNTVEYNDNTYSPGEIDRRIEKDTEELRNRLANEPSAGSRTQEKLGDYMSKMENAVKIDTSLWPAVPRLTTEDDDGRRYTIPEAPVISEAAVGRIRALAHFPKQEIGGPTTYESVETEPNDLDLVTVEANLDVSGLYNSFKESFEGSSVKPQWQDPCLAKPIFAAVELQRSRKLADGGWSDWQDVPRLKIDNMRSLLNIVERVEDLPRGGMKVRLLQYNKDDVMSDILQPAAYDIASAEERWFPPSLHEKYLSLMKEQQLAERREELDKARQEREKELEDARRNRRESRTVTSSRPSPGGGGGSGWMNAGPGGGSSSNSPVRRDAVKDRSDREQEREDLRLRREQEKEKEEDPDSQLEQIEITSQSQLEEMTEPLLFWSHDETVEPGNTYRYRIRLGVFNPLAGTNKLKSDSESYKDQVIIWSNFADTGTIEIPDRLYFFATDIREAANSVIVEVFRYAMGYWYSKEYVVEAGEVIGKLDTPEEPASSKETPETDLKQTTGILIPEKVDFRTKAVMVDTAAVDDWTGGRSLSPRNYFDMYYSYDGSSIESLPIRQRFWSSDMRSIYNDIRNQMRQPKQPFRARGTISRELTPSRTGPDKLKKKGSGPAWMYQVPSQ